MATLVQATFTKLQPLVHVYDSTELSVRVTQSLSYSHSSGAGVVSDASKRARVFNDVQQHSSFIRRPTLLHAPALLQSVAHQFTAH